MNISQRATWIVLIIILAGFTGCSTEFQQKPQKVDATVKVDTANVLCKDFLGAGVQCTGYPWFDISEADWQQTFRRMDYLKIPFTRVMCDWTNFFEGLDDNGNPVYIFESQKMRNNYKLLDYCQKNNMTVMFGHWGWANTALHAPDQNWDIAPDSYLHARISADLIDYVVNKKGYSCIKWFDLINEPDGNWSSCDGDWDLWARVAKQLNKELVRRGLTKKIKISGPADCYRGWIPNALADAELKSFLGSYNEHRYLRNKNVLNGQFEQASRDRVNAIKKADPGKKYFAAELGFLDGKNNATDQQLEVKKFWYGVSMADASIQMMRAGMDGYIAWYLDDVMHWKGDSDGPLEEPANAYEIRKTWGMWNGIGEEHGDPVDEELRPWFYVWSQLSRNFPPGCQIIEVSESGVDGLRTTAANIKGDISIAVVNNTDDPRAIKIIAPAFGTKNLKSFEYFDADGDNEVDSWPKAVDMLGNDIYPKPTKTFNNVNLKQGLIVELPSRGVVILTSL